MIAALGLGAVLAGCGGGSDDDDDVDDALIGPNRSYSEALVIAEEQWNLVTDLGMAEGGTPWADMPTSGSATYQGVITGWADGGPAISYVADLELEVDFSANGVTGTIGNVVTDGIADFQHPVGQVNLSGVVQPDSVNEGSLLLSGTGALSNAAAAATVVVDAEGFFLGTDARAIEGSHLTDFIWTKGPLTGSTSFADGLFSAVESN
jgi:hypothetical protein